MKTIGVIAEYNPFHGGHAYLIEEAKRRAHGDRCVVVMSGCYVQRGTPAVFDQHVRSAAALRGGADLVLELPSFYAASAAGRFARGAVAMLAGLGCVDALAFGWEGEDPRDWTLLTGAAEILSKAPAQWETLCRQGRKEGLTWPAARSRALEQLMAEADPASRKRLSVLLQQPNNILALEYLIMLEEQKKAGGPYPPIEPLPIPRKGAAYHSTRLETTFPSAGALRLAMEQAGPAWREALRAHVPSCWLPEPEETPGPLPPRAMDPILRHKLQGLTPEDLTRYLDVNRSLANRIYQNRFRYETQTQFAGLCKTKETTHAALMRALLHIFLELTQEEYETAQQAGGVPFGRVLALRQDAGELTGVIKERCSYPLISKAAQAPARLSPQSLVLWEKEMLRSQWYAAMVADVYKTPVQNAYTRRISKK